MCLSLWPTVATHKPHFRPVPEYLQAEALSDSSTVEVSDDNERVRRKDPLPGNVDENEEMKKAIYVVCSRLVARVLVAPGL